MVRWLSNVAGFLVDNLWVDKGSLQTNANLVGTSEADLDDICTAARFSNVLSGSLPWDETIASLEHQFGQKLDANVPLDTGFWMGRKGALFRFGTTVVLAFEATKANEVIRNTWSHANDKKWCPPHPRYLEGRQVHSLYLDMWYGMRQAAKTAIVNTIIEMEEQRQTPSRLFVTGHSMGGGIST